MKLRKTHIKIIKAPKSLDWQHELKRMLIAAGTEGIQQSRLTYRFHRQAIADEVVDELETLALQHKVQKFMPGGRGRPKTIWRATTEIMKP